MHRHTGTLWLCYSGIPSVPLRSNAKTNRPVNHMPLHVCKQKLPGYVCVCLNVHGGRKGTAQRKCTWENLWVRTSKRNREGERVTVLFVCSPGLAHSNACHGVCPQSDLQFPPASDSHLHQPLRQNLPRHIHNGPSTNQGTPVGPGTSWNGFVSNSPHKEKVCSRQGTKREMIFHKWEQDFLRLQSWGLWWPLTSANTCTALRLSIEALVSWVNIWEEKWKSGGLQFCVTN